MRIRAFLTRGFVLGLLLLVFFSPQGANAATDSYYTKESFLLAPDGTVVVEAAFQEVEVIQTADPTVEVEVSMTFQASSRPKVEILIDEYRPVFTVDEQRLEIRSSTKAPGISTMFAQASGKIRIKVPAKTSLIINTASGSCTFQGCFDADITANSASGDVSFRGEVKSFSVSTASGEIRADFEGPVARVEAHSVSGSIWLSGPVQTAQLHTVSGDINLHGSDGGKLIASTISGNLIATWETLSAPVIITAESVSGNLRFFFPADAKIRGELKSRSGRITSEFSGLFSGEVNTHFLHDDAADVQIAATTTNGAIDLRTLNHSSDQSVTAKTTKSRPDRPGDHPFTFPPKRPGPAAFLNIYRYEKRWAPGLKIRLYQDRFYLTGNLEYSYRNRDLNAQFGTVYFLNSSASWFSFYGGGGAHFSNKNGYQYPYLLVGTDFLFLFYELVYPWAEEEAPQHRFGLSIKL
ncbi:MAG: DUF4097 domain-containing protein [Firmicutes bacterium]|nr:DUF4097 domain-containing protein [Bacillota bacterium]